MSIKIPIREITSENIDFLEKRLYIQQDTDKHNKNYIKQEKIPFFKVDPSNQFINVPFYFGKEYFGDKFISNNPSISIPFFGQLREEQKSIESESLSLLKTKGSVLISAFPGFGKTFVTLKLLSELGMRAIIIVNKICLLKQWSDAIEQFLHIKPCIIKGKNSKVDNSRIYLVNSINIIKHPELTNLNIGVVVCDEAHLLMTKTFSEGLFLLNPSYIIGLSASPYRYDGFNALFDLFFGLKRLHRPLEKEHTVICVKSNEKIEHTVDKNNKINWNSVIEKQSMSETRNNLIVKYCEKYKERYILILCKRISQIKLLESKLKNSNISNLRVGTFYDNDIDFDKECNVLISTYQKASTGFSHDILDMLILGCDIDHFFIQTLGRVFRRETSKPIVVDILDSHPLLRKHFKSRENVYKEAGGKISSIIEKS